ncbi:hypothetical protein AVEN_40362-1 [Araneus ventricosus]|uniref:Uncharacterized protein n=1 Tax=Araneus ventricosus TaxID=182803 RepID=A0A4Y2M561_ARAVE|nr:hypothetical protein AVEN_40362-1 [Araneus ventricosus]
MITADTLMIETCTFYRGSQPVVRLILEVSKSEARCTAQVRSGLTICGEELAAFCNWARLSMHSSRLLEMSEKQLATLLLRVPWEIGTQREMRARTSNRLSLLR